MTVVGILIVEFIIPVNIHNIGAPLRRSPPSDGMISIEDFKSIVLDIVAAMAERVRVTEERAGNYFQDRTNIYRCEDGRPICYCCLRVGHVAKYCWDRRFSCPHTSFDQPTREPSFPGASVDVESLGRDVNRLLNELQGITRDLELSNTMPFRAEDMRVQTDVIERSPQLSPRYPTIEMPNIPEMRPVSIMARCDEGWQKEYLHPYTERRNQAKQAVSGILYGVT